MGTEFICWNWHNKVQHTFIFSNFCSLEFWDQDVGRIISSEASLLSYGWLSSCAFTSLSCCVSCVLQYLLSIKILVLLGYGPLLWFILKQLPLEWTICKHSPIQKYWGLRFKHTIGQSCKYRTSFRLGNTISASIVLTGSCCYQKPWKP